jgi:short subunit dehydrogenase-like uncharacterized protein
MGGGLLFALVADRDLSVVVFGATGVTGRQVAAYLAQRAEEADVRWAAAGRDPAKVERVLGEIGVTAPEIVAADIGDPATLEAMASRTRVVLDLVGPYTLYGQPVIEACIAAGAHYADLTGEIPFVRRMIETFQSQAEAAGVKIINVSGFEALPADLAVLLAAETARSRWDEALATVDLDASMPTPGGGIKPADVISGGTLQSLAEATGDERAELASDPSALITEPELAQRVRDTSPIAIAPRFNAEGDVIGPMLPSPFINPAVIHRTAALVAAEEKRDFEPFRYREGAALDGVPPFWPLRYAAAGALAGVQAAVRAISRAQPSTREKLTSVMRRRLPSSGFGPKGERLTDWTWKLTVNARTAGGHYVRVDLDADGHPGYLATARMLGEAGLLLAEDGATPARSGFLTPAAALGTAHLDRFERAEMRFSVSS